MAKEANKVCGAIRVFEGIEYVCHRRPGHKRWWHQNKDANFRWKDAESEKPVSETNS